MKFYLFSWRDAYVKKEKEKKNVRTYVLLNNKFIGP